VVAAEEFTKRCVDNAGDLNEHGINIALHKCRKKFGFSRL